MKVVYAGTFDPITNGHMNIIERASRKFDEVFVVISVNPGKKHLFTTQERLQLCKEAVASLHNVSVSVDDGLTVDFCKKVHADAMLRGIRDTKDYEYESGLAHVNAFLESDIETLFIMTKPELSFISSSYVKEVASYHRDVSPLVPEAVAKALEEKYKEEL